MYESHWGLREKPFENTPDPKFLYYSQQHEEAMARMLYVVRERKGGALLTGEYGCGKTLLTRVLKAELQKENQYQAVYIVDPRFWGLEFLQEIVHQLTGGPTPQTKIELFHTLFKSLSHIHSIGKHCIIVVDEAQSIKNHDTFEELRLLLNFQLDNAFLLTVILLGSPELRTLASNMPQLVQRMAVRYHINGLNGKETREYINHRLAVAGASKPIFTDEAYKHIFLCSEGVPRRINTICDLSLLIGFSNGLDIIDKTTVREINDDMGLPPALNDRLNAPSLSSLSDTIDRGGDFTLSP